MSSLLKDYIISGNSFFFPIIPNINMFWFLPKKYQILPITIGQCIDLIIILNLTCYLESLIYHYIKWTILNKDCQVIFGLNSFYLDTINKNTETCEEFKLNQDMRVKYLRKSKDDSSVNYKLDWNNDPVQRKKRCCLDHKRKDFRPIKLILQIFNNYNFWITHLKICHSHPNIIDFNDFLVQEGGKTILNIDLMDFLKKNTKLLRI